MILKNTFMLEKILNEKKIILVCGSGGVGKTTLAASLALKGATLGKKTIVLTIDPAKRLATSMGLAKLGGEPTRISPKNIEAQTGHKDIFLDAMMLDTKRTFDELVTRYAPNAAVKDRILENKIYLHLSNMMAGSQEYMAMEKLHDLVGHTDYDLIVVDTPPTTHAIDFLEAPDRMMSMLGDSMIHVLLKPALAMGKSGFFLFDKGAKLILKVLDKITGFELLKDVADMLDAFREMLGGFESRASDVKKMLQSNKSVFVLVTANDERSVSEARFFDEKMKSLQLNLNGIIMNRCFPFSEASEKEVDEDLKELSKKYGFELAEKITQVRKNEEPLIEEEIVRQKEMKSLLEKGQFFLKIPLFQGDVHDLEGLWSIASYL